MKRFLLGLLFGSLFFASVATAASVLQGNQGGTGFGPTTSISNVGKALTVASSSPLSYTFTTISGGGGSSQWTTTTLNNGIYYNNGFVVIGTTTPTFVPGLGTSTLSLRTDTTSNLQTIVASATNTLAGTAFFADQGGVNFVGAAFGSNSNLAPNSVWKGQVAFETFGNNNPNLFLGPLGSLVFSPGYSEVARVTTTGFGVGTTTPLMAVVSVDNTTTGGIYGVGSSIATYSGFAPNISTYNGQVFPYGGSGDQMIWYPRRGAFRAGITTANVAWNDSTMGDGSAAFGLDARATGQGSFAAGLNVSATGDGSIAMGYTSAASGQAAMALGGFLNLAVGANSVTLGQVNTAQGNTAMAFGYGNFALGDKSFALGQGMTVHAEDSFGINLSTTTQASIPTSSINLFSIVNGQVAIGTTTISDNNIPTTFLVESPTGNLSQITINNKTSALGSVLNLRTDNQEFVIASFGSTESFLDPSLASSTIFFPTNAPGPSIIINNTTGNVSLTAPTYVGTAQVKGVYTATSASLGGSLLTIGTCASVTSSVANVTNSMTCNATPATYPGDGNYWYCYISSANVVTTKVCAVATLTPTASLYNLRITP